jgi:serine/threonine protein kinase
MAAQVARALVHLKAHTILHRDIKPANVLLDECGRPRCHMQTTDLRMKARHAHACGARPRRYGVVKLADFGVGRSLDMLPHGAAKTRLVGTPLYFSPEMCEVPLAPPAGSPPRPSGRTLRRWRAGGAASRRSAGLRVV